MENLNVEEPENVLEIDPLMDLNYDTAIVNVVRKGPSECTIYELASDSLSNTNIVFQNVAPPSLLTVSSRNFRIKYRLTATVTFPNTAVTGNYPFPNAIYGQNLVGSVWPINAGAGYTALRGQQVVDIVTAGVGGGGVGGIGATLSLRAFPLNSCLSTCDVKLNGSSTSISSNDVICMQPYIMKDEEQRFYECPTLRDSSALYTTTALQNNRNPFNLHSQNDSSNPRGGFMAILVSETTAANVITRVYAWDIVEPLVISPLTFSDFHGTDAGFANLVNISINLRIQDIQRSVSLASSVAGSTVTMNLSPSILDPNSSTTASLLMNYNSQDAILSARMQPQLYYAYDDVQVDANSNAIATKLNNASPLLGSFIGNALRLSTIPNRLYVYLKASKAEYTGATSQTITDTFLGITKIQIQFQNRSNLLASYTQNDLYRMSVKNGLTMSFHEFSKSVGSIVIIDIVSDLGLQPDESSGENKYNQLRCDVSYSTEPLQYGVQTQQVKYDAIVVVVTAGEAIITPNTCKFQTSSITGTEVIALTAMGDSKVTGGGLRGTLASRGGSLFSNIGKHLSKGLSFLKENPEYLKKGLEYGQKGLQSLGLGGGVSGGMVSGGKLRHRRT